jgi:dTDP-4-amino-4,6-dideoxygalactose transaminase
MVVPFVDLKIQYHTIKTEIDRAIADVLENGTFIGGEPVNRFENEFARQYGVKHVIGVASGTDALYIVLKMLGITTGDEVITTAMSWVATAESITRTGATPVFVDVDSKTYTIDPNLIEQKITPKTKAILPVHLYGHVADMSKILDLCRSKNLLLIEDCAQAHFAEDGGLLAGKFGIAAAFSFYPTKNLGAYGDAGCIITNDDLLAEKCRRFANHGALKRNDHKMEGINSRLDTLQAAILSVKLKHALRWTEQRRKIAGMYRALLIKDSRIILPFVRSGCTHAFHLFVIRIKERDVLKKYLEAEGIQTAIHYPLALPNLTFYKSFASKSEFSIASQIQSEVLSLPVFPELTDDQVGYVTNSILRFFNV